MKSKKKIKNNRIKKEKIFIAMDKSCLLNHCLPEYIEYQEQIPNHYKIGSKSKTNHIKTNHIKTKKNKQIQIMKSLEKCSKKNCSK
jgi:hypothetical protein